MFSGKAASWEEEADHFVDGEDLDSCEFSVRAIGSEVILSFYNKIDEDVVSMAVLHAAMSLLEASSALFDSSNGQDSQWWKMRESAVNLVGILSHLLLNSAQDEGDPVEYACTMLPFNPLEFSDMLLSNDLQPGGF